MHSTIIQLSDKPLSSCEWATESDFYNDLDNKLDYCDLLEGDGRESRVNDLMSPDGLLPLLFRRGGSRDVLVFKGRKALLEVRGRWLAEIRRALDELKGSGRFDTFRLLHAVNRVGGVWTLFCLSGWSGDRAVYPCELLEWLDTLEDNQPVHVGAVLDYHF